MIDFIKRLQAKPLHVRERIAYGTAAGVTSIVALVWFTTSLMTTGMLAPELSSTAYFNLRHEASATVVDHASNPASGYLAGAAGASLGAKQSSKAHLQIVDVSRSSTLVASSTPKKTVLPF